jgi:signal transduction histidine kinase
MPTALPLRFAPVPASHSPSALEALARLRTMRALIPGEDRFRFERLISDVEHAVWETESVTADLARLLAIGITEALPPRVPVELTDLVAAALRLLDPLLASRGIVVNVEAAAAVFAMGDRERLEHLLSTALAIAAHAAPSRSQVRLRYGLLDTATVFLVLSPYRPRDPRATIVDALARAQQVELRADEETVSMRMPAAVGAASV